MCLKPLRLKSPCSNHCVWIQCVWNYSVWKHFLNLCVWKHCVSDWFIFFIFFSVWEILDEITHWESYWGKMSNASSVVYVSVNDGSIRYRLVKHFCNVVSALKKAQKKHKNGFDFHFEGSNFAFRERINDHCVSKLTSCLTDKVPKKRN